MICTTDGEQYLYANLVEDNEEFNVFLAGVTYPNPAYFIRKNNLNKTWKYYTFEWILSGSGTVRTQDGVSRVQAGDLVFCSRYCELEMRADPEQPYKKLFLIADGRLLDALLAAYNLKESVIVRKADAGDLFEGILNRLAVFPQEKKQEVFDETACDLMRLLQLLRIGRKRENRTDTAALKIKKYLDSHLKRPVTLEDAAESVGYSKTQMIALFREAYGVTPKKYLMQQRIAAACEMLRETQMSVGEIAAALCFSDAKHFSHTFHEFKGVSPSGYRMNSSEDQIFERLS